MKTSRRIRTALGFGLAAGLFVALAASFIVTAREWMLNPGGIYHGPDGTDWRIVLETAWSWFAPLFLAIAGVAAGIRFFLPWARRDRGAS